VNCDSKFDLRVTGAKTDRSPGILPGADPLAPSVSATVYYHGSCPIVPAQSMPLLLHILHETTQEQNYDIITEHVLRIDCVLTFQLK